MIRAAALLLLAGCATSAPMPPPAAKPIDMAAIRALLQPCPIEAPRKYAAMEATRVANARRDALIQCNRDKAAALEKLEHP